MKKVALPAMCLLIVGLAVGLVFTSIVASDLREENRNLRKQLENLSAQNLEPKPVEAPSAPAAGGPNDELIRLRGELVTLR